MQKLKFSGHESFICKQFWLPKGLDFVWNQNGNFNAKDAVVHLGVGKNMVASIRFWLKAFGMIEDDDYVVPLAEKLFGEAGWDPYIEETGTVWLLHYQLVKTGYASIYGLVFNEFQVGRPQFTEEHLLKFAIRKCEETEASVNKNSIIKDIKVFLRSYLRPTIGKKTDIEEEFTRLLIELGLIQTQVLEDALGEKRNWYTIPRDDRDDLPWEIVLYTILDQKELDTVSISFDQIYKLPNSPGLVFGLTEEGLSAKIGEMTEHIPGLVYSETAGNRVLQINKEIDKYEVLDGYYKN